MVCPWHRYPVTLAGGRKLYQTTVKSEADGKLLPGPWASVGLRQRTHEAQQRPDGVWVRLSSSPSPSSAAAAAAPEPHASDEYAHNAACGARMAGNHVAPVQRSGAVFQSARGADGCFGR